MSLAWIVVSFLEYGTNIVSGLGVIISAIGSLTVIYPDLENKYATGMIRRVAPKVEKLELARENYQDEGAVTDLDQLDPLLKFAEVRYLSDETSALHAELMGGIESVERIERTNEGAVGCDSQDREWNFGPKQAGAGAIEADLLFSRTLQRYCRQRGMRLTATGFFLLLLGHLLGIVRSALAM